eukprot:13335980-Alexandrium_andersonii.AAC.1
MAECLRHIYLRHSESAYTCRALHATACHSLNPDHAILEVASVQSVGAGTRERDKSEPPALGVVNKACVNNSSFYALD